MTNIIKNNNIYYYTIQKNKIKKIHNSLQKFLLALFLKRRDETASSID